MGVLQAQCFSDLTRKWSCAQSGYGAQFKKTVAILHNLRLKLSSAGSRSTDIAGIYDGCS